MVIHFLKKNAKKSYFIMEKIHKYRKCPALRLLLTRRLGKKIELPSSGPDRIANIFQKKSLVHVGGIGGTTYECVYTCRCALG